MKRKVRMAKRFTVNCSRCGNGMDVSIKGKKVDEVLELARKFDEVHAVICKPIYPHEKD